MAQILVLYDANRETVDSNWRGWVDRMKHDLSCAVVRTHELVPTPGVRLSITERASLVRHALVDQMSKTAGASHAVVWTCSTAAEAACLITALGPGYACYAESASAYPVAHASAIASAWRRGPR